MVARPIYLDNHATTRVDPRVWEAMQPHFCDDYGNPASINHSFGWTARDAVERARDEVASLLGVESRALVWTSGATEANNLAIKGVLRASDAGSHLIVNAAEHRAVLDPAARLRRAGYDVTVLPVDPYGQVSPQDVAAAIRPHTVLVSLMAANNEVGTLNAVGEVGELCRQRGVLLHCDATQALGKVPFNLGTLPIDLASFSAHKLYGPKGVGALYVRRGSPRIVIEPQLDGGGHERHLRSGTLPVPLIVGFGACCHLALRSMHDESQRIAELRNNLADELTRLVEGLEINGHPTQRLPGNLNVSIPDVDGDALMTAITKIAVSSGSACTSADPQPSHVLKAMGKSDALTRASLRFGIGRFNTHEEIALAVEHVSEVVAKLRRTSRNR